MLAPPLIFNFFLGNVFFCVIPKSGNHGPICPSAVQIIGPVTLGGAWFVQGHRQEVIVLLLGREWDGGKEQWERARRGSQEEEKSWTEPAGGGGGGEPPRLQETVIAPAKWGQDRAWHLVPRSDVKLWPSHTRGPGVALCEAAGGRDRPSGPTDSGSKPNLAGTADM